MTSVKRVNPDTVKSGFKSLSDVSRKQRRYRTPGKLSYCQLLRKDAAS